MLRLVFSWMNGIDLNYVDQVCFLISSMPIDPWHILQGQVWDVETTCVPSRQAYRADEQSHHGWGKNKACPSRFCSPSSKHAHSPAFYMFFSFFWPPSVIAREKEKKAIFYIFKNCYYYRTMLAHQYFLSLNGFREGIKTANNKGRFFFTHKVESSKEICISNARKCQVFFWTQIPCAVPGQGG